MNPADPRVGPNPGVSSSITTLATREVYRNHWMRVREDLVLRANGQQGVYGVVEKHDAAIMLAIEDGCIWLVEQFRYTIGARALELPQGGWEEDIDNPEDLARGELREEIGMDASRMQCLGQLWIAYGFLRQKQFVYLATGLTPAQATRDAEEHDLTARRVPIADFERMLLDGIIRDNCTLAAWGLYRMWKEQRG